MKIIRTITISEQEYFDYLTSSLLAEMNKGLGAGEAPYTVEDLMKGITVTRNKDNVFKKDQFTVESYTPYTHMTGHISSVIEESTFEYSVQPLNGGKCTVTYTAFVTKKLEKPKSKAGQMWTQALSLSKMANEIIDIEAAVNRKKNSGKRPF